MSRSRRRLGLLGLAASALLAAGCAEAEPDVGCEGCALTLERGRRLLPGEEVRFVASTQVEAAGNGNLFLAPLADPSAVAMYSSAGRLLGVLGRKGSGPGALQVVKGVYAVGDSIYVVENGGEVEIFDAEGRWGRTLPSTSGADAFWPLPYGEMLVRRGGELGPLFVISENDSARVELAPSTSAPGGREPSARHVTVDLTGRVWTTLSGPRDDDFYVVEGFDPEGGAPVRWEQRVDGLLGKRRFGGATHYARVRDLALTAPDTLMVLLYRSPRSIGESAVGSLTIAEVTDRYDPFLDLFDPRERRFIGRLRLPKTWIGGFVRPGEIFSIVERDDRELVVQLWTLRIS